MRQYWDEKESLMVDRDVNAAINIKRVGLGLFPTIKRRRGNRVVTKSTTNSTSKEVLAVLRIHQKPTSTPARDVGSSPYMLTLAGKG